MAEKSWYDINDPGFFHFGKSAPKQQAQKTPQEQSDAEPFVTAMQKTPVVRLISPQWLPGLNGFAFNEKCRVRVAVTFQKETSRKRVTFTLSVESAAGKEDLNCTADGIEEGGFAEAEFVLYYGGKYYELIGTDPSQKCWYRFSASHPDANDAITSDALEMPGAAQRTSGATQNDSAHRSPLPANLFGAAVASVASESDVASVLKENVVDNKLLQKLLLGDIPGVMAYCPMSVATNAPAYLFIPTEELGSFAKNVLAVQAEMKMMGETLAQARKLADPLARMGAIKTFESQYAKRFIDAQNGAAIPKFQEIVLLNASPALSKFMDSFVYVDAAAVQAGWMHASDSALASAIQAKVDGTLKPLAEYVKDSVKKKLWATAEAADGGQFGRWNFVQEAVDTSGLTGEQNQALALAGTHEAAFVRALAAANGTNGFDQNDVPADICNAGSLSMSVRGGVRTTFDLHYPCADGVDLFKLVKAIDSSVVKPGRTCFIRFRLHGSAQGYMAAQCALSLPCNAFTMKSAISSSHVVAAGGENKMQVAADVAAPLFGNAAAGMRVICDGEWKDPVTGAWKSFIREGGTIAASQPQALDEMVSIDFSDGAIVLTIKVDLITGLSGDVCLVYSMTMDDAFGLLEHILESAGFKKLAIIKEKCYDAFLVYQYYRLLQDTTMFASMKSGAIETVSTWWHKAVGESAKIVAAALDVATVMRTAPEVVARLLSAFIGNHQPTDYENILRLLDQVRAAHAGVGAADMQAAVVRYLGCDNPAAARKQKDASLQKGKDLLLNYFEHPLSSASQTHIDRLEAALKDI